MEGKFSKAWDNQETLSKCDTGLERWSHVGGWRWEGRSHHLRNRSRERTGSGTACEVLEGPVGPQEAGRTAELKLKFSGNPKDSLDTTH